MPAGVDEITAWYDELSTHDAEFRRLLPEALTHLTGDRCDIVGVGVLTDADARTLLPCALSKAHLAVAGAEDPALSVFYAWCPDEWDLQLPRDAPSLLDPVMAHVRTLAETVRDEDWSMFTSTVFAWLAQQMATCRDLIEARYGAVNVVMWPTDADEPAENVIEWVEEMNPAGNGKPYADYLRRR